MRNETFQCQCIFNVLEGLQDGLSHYSGPSQVALLYALGPRDPIHIFDPQNLLRGHEPIFKELYIDSNGWRDTSTPTGGMQNCGQFYPEKNLQLAGLISYGARSNSLFYQMWFSEHHPDMCAIGPTECWLEHAAWLLSHDFATATDIYTATSGYVLREYATHAVRDYMVDQMNVLIGWDTPIRVYSILDTVLGISKTREEGAWPQGELVFAEPRTLGPLDLVVRFRESERPSLENFKHVRKLLQAVENSDYKLVSDGQNIVGIFRGELPGFGIVADFCGGYGFLRINGKPICSFADGNFHSTTHKAKLVQVEEILLESDLDPSVQHRLFQILLNLVHHAETQKYGCTFVIDLNPLPINIAGQGLMPPLDLCQPDFLELAQSLARVDGALLIGSDLKLHAFASLLDGHSTAGEDRARGARFNSALRFTAEHDHIVVVVVSADRPVSIILEGAELNAQCQWKPVSGCITAALTLERWLKRKGP